MSFVNPLAGPKYLVRAAVGSVSLPLGLQTNNYSY
jgi:hypothetical protein